MSDLSFHVREFIPDAEGEELQHRMALLRARDWASAVRGRTLSTKAYDLAAEAAEVASAFVFAIGETTTRLESAAKLARHLVHAAVLAELLETTEAHRG